MKRMVAWWRGEDDGFSHLRSCDGGGVVKMMVAWWRGEDNGFSHLGSCDGGGMVKTMSSAVVKMMIFFCALKALFLRIAR
mgnify:CR=1 FL=1